MNLKKDPDVRMLVVDDLPDLVDVQGDGGLWLPGYRFAAGRVRDRALVIASIAEYILDETP